MKHTFTFEGTLNEKDFEELNKLQSMSINIILVERTFGFVEIHKEDDIEYTTADILEKGI